MRPSLPFIHASLLITFGALTASHAAPRYQVIDVGSLGGPNFYETFSGITGKLLNNNGFVASGMDTAVPDPTCGGCLASHGFLWFSGQPADLGVLVPGDQGNFSQSFSLNDRNNCAGIATYNVLGDSGEPLYRAVMWKWSYKEPIKMIDLGTLGGTQSLAHAINNQDQIVGWSLDQTPAPVSIWEDYPWPFGTRQRAVLWENGSIQDLGTLGGPSAWATHINDRGQVIGQSYSDVDSGDQKTVESLIWSRPVAAFLWENGTMVDLGNLGGTYALPTRISNEGQVIGLMSTTGDKFFHPFLWTNGVLKDLGTFGGTSGRANAINELGEVVGGAGLANGLRRAFLWRNGELKNLGTLGLHSQAWHINSRTQVVGASGSSRNDYRAFLWEDNGEPMRDLNDLVPEGSPLLATGQGINERGEILCAGRFDEGLYLLVPSPTLSIRVSESPAGRRIVVEAQTIPGRKYRLESSTDLKTWTTVGDVVVTVGETLTKEFELQGDSSYYRLAGPLF